jgi:hypothetical protein
MPCSDGPTDQQIIQQYRRSLDELTALMCATMGDLDAQGLLPKTRGDAQEWFSRHKAKDIIRLQQEALNELRVRRKREALSRLTPEEKDALYYLPLDYHEAT